MLTYQVEVHTGYMPNAGTDANVRLMLVGQRGDTGYRQMLKPLASNASKPFQLGQVNAAPLCSHAFSCFLVLFIFKADEASRLYDVVFAAKPRYHIEKNRIYIFKKCIVVFVRKNAKSFCLVCIF